MESAGDKVPSSRRFWITIILLKIAGLPIHEEQLSVLQLTYDGFVSVSSYSVFIASLVDVCLNSDDLKRSMGTIRLIFAMVMIILAEMNFRFHKDTLRRLFLLTESFTWEDLPLTDPDTGGLTAAGLMPRIDNILKKFIPVSVGIHLVQTTVRIITSRDMMYNGWYPFDASLSPNYEIVIFSQFLALFRFFALFYACPHLYVTTVCIACTQLKKLEIYMSEVKQQITSKAKSREDGSNQDYKCRMERQLKDIILHHQQIIKYIHTLDELTGLWLGCVFLCVLLTLCTAAFSAVMSLGDATELIQCVFAYVQSMLMTFMYCSFGTFLSQEYESISNAVWASDWVGTSVSYQRSISFIINISNQGFELTAGKVVPVSNATLMNMVNESLSLFMFLLTMKDKNEGAS